MQFCSRPRPLWPTSPRCHSFKNRSGSHTHAITICTQRTRSRLMISEKKMCCCFLKSTAFPTRSWQRAESISAPTLVGCPASMHPVWRPWCNWSVWAWALHWYLRFRYMAVDLRPTGSYCARPASRVQYVRSAWCTAPVFRARAL